MPNPCCAVPTLCGFLFFDSSGAKVTLETLSHSPRVFSLKNFMDMEEADNIIEDALGMTQEAYRLKVCFGRCGRQDTDPVLTAVHTAK